MVYHLYIMWYQQMHFNTVQSLLQCAVLRAVLQFHVLCGGCGVFMAHSTTQPLSANQGPLVCFLPNFGMGTHAW